MSMRGKNLLRAAWDWLLGRNNGPHPTAGYWATPTESRVNAAPHAPRTSHGATGRTVEITGTATSTEAHPNPFFADAARSMHHRHSVDAQPDQSRTAFHAREVEVTVPLTLARVRLMLTETMGYTVERSEDESGHATLSANWNGFPFIIEEPEGHEGMLLVTGEWEEAAALSQRDEIAASVNDWNREKFFPTVSIVDTPVGPIVRAMYIVDLATGVTHAQLRLHLDTALSSCTQALEQVAPLLPEL